MTGGESRMTLRVSRDSGRSWGPVREVRTGEGSGREQHSPVRYPPCACPRCAPLRAAEARKAGLDEPG